MIWHIDPEVEQALIRLNDAICEFERQTGRDYTLILVPHQLDEECHVSLNGKPVPRHSAWTLAPQEAVLAALRERKG
jgi:hypothetical protein